MGTGAINSCSNHRFMKNCVLESVLEVEVVHVAVSCCKVEQVNMCSVNQR